MTAILQEQMTKWLQLERRGEKASDCFLRKMIQTYPETARDRTALWNPIYMLQAHLRINWSTKAHLDRYLRLVSELGVRKAQG
jgi:hypothetical protein